MNEADRAEAILRDDSIIGSPLGPGQIEILEGFPDAVVLIDANGCIAFANTRVVHLFECPSTELVGRSTDSLFADGADRACSRYVTDCLEAPQSHPVRAELSGERGDGSRIPLEATLNRLSLCDQTMVLCTLRDISDRQRVRQQVAQTDARFNEAQRIAKIGSWEWDVVNDRHWWSPALYRMLEIDPDCGGSPFDLFIHRVRPEDLQRMSASRDEALAGNPTDPVDIRLEMPDGTGRVVQTRGEVEFDAEGRPVRVTGTLQDVTEWHELEEQLRDSEERYSSTVELAAVGITHIDEDGRFLRSNKWFREMLGYSEEELLQLTIKDVSHPDDIDVTDKDRASLHAGATGAINAEKRYLRKDGDVIWVRITSALRRSPDGTPLYDISIVEDITDRKRAEARVQYLATHDEMTSLPNRALFAEVLDHAIESAKRHRRQCAVLFIDLDRFKIVNDSLGHAAGDLLLKEVSTRLRACMRKSDVVARLGGDEFVVLLEELDTAGAAEEVARKILSALLPPIEILGHECRITASIGIATYPEDARDAASLMKHADMAMYLAKEEGKNNYQLYSADTSPVSVERLILETHLARALERDEFSVHYQAKVNLGTGKVNGAEALLRWWNPELGATSPAQFIPVAEDTGLIVPIGKWVLRSACEQNAEWQRRGLPSIVMSVNLSPRQFKHPALLDDIAEILEQTGLAPELLELEITESMIMHDVDNAAEKVAAIKELGVKLAIDDFGTGYSSLSQLKRFPIDTLKVDRSFVREIPNNQEDKAITEAIISLGKTLGVTVVAEGVENESQHEFLRSRHCDEIQGHYFGKPCPPEAFARLLNTMKSD